MTLEDDIALVSNGMTLGAVTVMLEYSWRTPVGQTLVDPASGGPEVEALYINDHPVDERDYPELMDHMARLAWDQYWGDNAA